MIKRTFLLLMFNSIFANSIEMNVSTLGLGETLTVGLPITDLALKFNMNSATGVKVLQTTFNINSLGGILSYKFYKNLSIEGGGYYLQGNTSLIDNVHATIAGFHGDIVGQMITNFGGIAPYLGLNYTSNNDTGFYIGSSVGVLYYETNTKMIMGGNFSAPDASIKGNGQISGYVRNDLFYPVISFSVGYSF